MSDATTVSNKNASKKMNVKNVLADLSVVRKSQAFSFEVYAEDAEALQSYVDFKKKNLGGEITLAEVFNRLVKVLLTDVEYAAAYGQLSQK